MQQPCVKWYNFKYDIDYRLLVKSYPSFIHILHTFVYLLLMFLRKDMLPRQKPRYSIALCDLERRSWNIKKFRTTMFCAYQKLQWPDVSFLSLFSISDFWKLFYFSFLLWRLLCHIVELPCEIIHSLLQFLLPIQYLCCFFHYFCILGQCQNCTGWQWTKGFCLLSCMSFSYASTSIV